MNIVFLSFELVLMSCRDFLWKITVNLQKSPGLRNTSYPSRFISSWDLFGIYKERLYLLDKRRNSPLCSYSNDMGLCKQNDSKSFRVQHPGYFQKFRFVHVGVDSMNQNIFSRENQSVVEKIEFTLNLWKHNLKNWLFIHVWEVKRRNGEKNAHLLKLKYKIKT